jgi:predicted nuclease of predicted toxin-antitoxin system
VKFLIDAQLPARLAGLLSAAGHDVVHTSQLPDGNRTTDTSLATVADAEDRVVITKDRDFRDSHLLRRTPRRLVAYPNTAAEKALAASACIPGSRCWYTDSVNAGFE